MLKIAECNGEMYQAPNVSQNGIWNVRDNTSDRQMQMTTVIILELHYTYFFPSFFSQRELLVYECQNLVI